MILDLVTFSLLVVALVSMILCNYTRRRVVYARCSLCGAEFTQREFHGLADGEHGSRVCASCELPWVVVWR